MAMKTGEGTPLVRSEHPSANYSAANGSGASGAHSPDASADEGTTTPPVLISPYPVVIASQPI